MNEIISAIVFNLRATLNKTDKLKEEVKRLSDKKDERNQKLEIEIKQKLNEATAVIIIFDDLMEEVEEMVSSYQSSVGSSRKFKNKVNKGVMKC